MKNVIYFICIFFVITTHAQQKDSIATSFLANGKELLFYGTYDEATLSFQEALKLSKNTLNNVTIAASYNALSQACNYKSLVKEAFQYAEKALYFSRKAGELGKREEANALDNIGQLIGKIGNPKLSLTNHTNALQIRLDYFEDEKLLLAESYFNLGVAFHRNRQFEKALEKLAAALSIDAKETPQRTILHANIYETKGFIHYDLGKYDAALAFFEKTAQLAQNVYKNNHPYFGKVYNNFGLIYSVKEEFNESLEYYNKALSVSIHNYGVDNHAEQVRIHFNIGTIYQRKGLKEKALFHTKKTLDLGTKFYGANHPKMFFPYSQLGTIYGDEKGIPYLKKALNIALSAPKVNYVMVSYLYEYLSQVYYTIKNYEEALVYNEKSLEIRRKIHGEKNIHTIRNYNNIAKIHAAMKNFDKALLFNEKAYENNFSSNIHMKTRFPYANHVDPTLLLETIKTKGEIHLLLFEETQKKEYLAKSNLFFKEAVSFINLVRNSKQNHQDKITFSETVKTVYAKNIQTTLMLHELDTTNVSLVATFYASEKSKAYVLRELLKKAEAKRNTNLHTAILTLEKNINDELADLQSKILMKSTKKETDTANLYTLEGKFFDVQKRKDSLEKSIEIQFPKYYKMKYEDTVIELATLQEKLTDSTTLLEFFKDQNTVYAFIISKHTFHVEKLQIDDVDERIIAFNTSIVAKDNATYTENALYLYEQLLVPIKDRFVGNELIIIPDESLWHLQFDLLLTTTSKNNENPSYLLYEYAISYANAASLLFEKNEKKDSTLQSDCLAFSYTSKDSIHENTSAAMLSDVRNSKIDLPGTRKEINAISKILEGSYFYGTSANEMNFKQNADKFKIIHLALHGDIDNQNSDNLKIYFSKGSTNEDDQLFGHEVYNLHIPASLVVLSACNTGNGKINKAEGIQSLGNAFQYAGAKSLLLSRWEISDKTTPEFMGYFYTHIKAGLPKHKALQQAKIDFLHHSNYFTSAPFYWGSFYVLGETSPIVFEQQHTTTSIVFVIIGVLLIVLIVYFFIRKRKQIQDSKS
ncbi:CHAT domain-containing protein [Kordia sp.]|uniref:CHAT domain-containing protein n=1 Tax=Kordia sp. TaxID=1965332 RepID=UPI003D2E6638